MGALVNQYATSLDTESAEIDLIKGRIEQNVARNKEPIASAEMSLRLEALEKATKSKQDALTVYSKAIDALPAAFAKAVDAVDHPDNSAIAASIQTFVTQAKNAHDKIAKAFP
jgi:hypothetical protein